MAGNVNDYFPMAGNTVKDLAKRRFVTWDEAVQIVGSEAHLYALPMEKKTAQNWRSDNKVPVKSLAEVLLAWWMEEHAPKIQALVAEALTEYRTKMAERLLKE
jgi:hypothetical protein